MPRKRLLWGLLILALCAGAPLGYLLWQANAQRRELAEVIAELDREEPNWRFFDMVRKRKHVPPARNSADVILAAYAKFPKAFGDIPILQEIELMPPNKALTAAQENALWAAVQPFEAGLADALAIADMDEGSFAITYNEDIISTLIPHAQKVREMAAWLAHDAALKAHKGNLAGACLSARAALNAGRSFGDEPFTVTVLVRIACVRLALDALERTLASGDAPDSELDRLQRLLEKEWQEDFFPMAARTERGVLHQIFSLLDSKKIDFKFIAALSEQNASTSARAFGFIGNSQNSAHTQGLRYANQAVKISKLPVHEQFDAIEKLQAEYIDLPEVAKLLTPNWKKFHGNTFLRGKAQAACGMLGVALERYRQKHGHWPDKLEALLPDFVADIPPDPCDGQPLRYRKTKDGVVVYSIGPSKAMQGDRWDGLRNGESGQRWEFRLWDVEMRRK
ncbi:MAG: hypothetical protein L0Y72_14705 [Gemmataceae bacterium]|nr:hypothetical protein [Gemmataceae bacterium]MCI0740293.1 hypothetical protein [Gemmataceae bacterium]